MRVGFVHHPGGDIRRVVRFQRRRRAAGEARHREIKRAPEEMRRAHLAEEARAKDVEHAVGLHQLAPEHVRRGGIVACVRAVGVEGIAPSISTGIVQMRTSTSSARSAAITAA